MDVPDVCKDCPHRDVWAPILDKVERLERQIEHVGMLLGKLDYDCVARLTPEEWAKWEAAKKLLKL